MGLESFSGGIFSSFNGNYMKYVIFSCFFKNSWAWMIFQAKGKRPRETSSPGWNEVDYASSGESENAFLISIVKKKMLPFRNWKSITLFWPMNLAWHILSPDTWFSSEPNRIRISLVSTPHINFLFSTLIISVPGTRCPNQNFFFFNSCTSLRNEKEETQHTLPDCSAHWLVYWLSGKSIFICSKEIECALFGVICAQQEDELKETR